MLGLSPRLSRLFDSPSSLPPVDALGFCTTCGKHRRYTGSWRQQQRQQNQAGGVQVGASGINIGSSGVVIADGDPCCCAATAPCTLNFTCGGTTVHLVSLTLTLMGTSFPGSNSGCQIGFGQTLLQTAGSVDGVYTVPVGATSGSQCPFSSSFAYPTVTCMQSGSPNGSTSIFFVNGAVSSSGAVIWAATLGSAMNACNGCSGSPAFAGSGFSITSLCSGATISGSCVNVMFNGSITGPNGTWSLSATFV